MAGTDPEHEGFRRLFDNAYRPLLAYALRRTQRPADAEEIVAETLLVAWRRRADMPEGKETIPWLYGVARRVIANQRRGQDRRRRLERLLERPTPAARDPEDLAHVGETTRAVLAAFRRLSARDQEVLRLAAWEGLAHREIAVSLGCSENAARLRLHHARRRLQKDLLKRNASLGQELVEVSDESQEDRSRQLC